MPQIDEFSKVDRVYLLSYFNISSIFKQPLILICIFYTDWYNCDWQHILERFPKKLLEQ